MVLTYSLGHVLEQTVHWCCSILTEFTVDPLSLCSFLAPLFWTRKCSKSKSVRLEARSDVFANFCTVDRIMTARQESFLRVMKSCREIASARPAARHRYAHERNSGSDIAERARHCGDGMELMVGTHGHWGVVKAFFLLNKSGGQEYHAQFYPRVFQRRTLSQIAGWLVHSCWGWRLCKIASSI